MNEKTERKLIQYWIGNREQKDLVLLKEELAWLETKDSESAEFLVMLRLLKNGLMEFCVGEGGKLSLSLNDHTVPILKQRIAYLEGRLNGKTDCA